MSVTAQARLKTTVVLVGLMGAGKSTVGRRLAKSLGVEFRDSDDEIAHAAGCSIPDLFKTYGEDMFRDLEQRVILRLLREQRPMVLATGGGAWMNPQVREGVATRAVSIWLRADLDILVERVGRRDSRPLLARGNKRDTLRQLMDQRYPIYEKADITIDSNRGHHDHVVTSVIDALKDSSHMG